MKYIYSGTVFKTQFQVLVLEYFHLLRLSAAFWRQRFYFPLHKSYFLQISCFIRAKVHPFVNSGQVIVHLISHNKYLSHMYSGYGGLSLKMTIIIIYFNTVLQPD